MSTPDTDRLMNQAIKLQELLSAAPGRRLSVRAVKMACGLADAELDRACELISTLADRASGARAGACRDGDSIVLAGSDSTLRPLRLSAEESLVLAHMLDELDIGADAAGRIRSALGPVIGRQAADRQRLAAGTTFGRLGARLAEAAEDGVRCVIAYRTQGEEAPRERVVDPLAIEARHGVVYLVGWDVDVDASRRYRLERISSLRLTDDSVERHPRQHRGDDADTTAAEQEALVSLPSASYARGLLWPGMHLMAEDPARPQGILARVPVLAAPWLFDQVLASAGAIRIMKPQELRRGFISYARARASAATVPDSDPSDRDRCAGRSDSAAS